MAEVLRENQVCEACVLSLHRNSVVRPDGNTNAKIMIVGEGPGYLEDLARIPLVGSMELRGSRCSDCSHVLGKCFGGKVKFERNAFGRKSPPVQCTPDHQSRNLIPESKFYLYSSGTVFDGVLLKGFGGKYPRQNWVDKHNKENPENLLKDSPFFITNATHCRSWDNLQNKDQPPTYMVAKICKKWLSLQWAAVNPEIIISLGRVSLAVLMSNEKGAFKVRSGDTVETRFGTVLYQTHPAAIMREENREIKALGFAKILESIRRALEAVGLEK